MGVEEGFVNGARAWILASHVEVVAISTTPVDIFVSIRGWRYGKETLRVQAYVVVLLLSNLYLVSATQC